MSLLRLSLGPALWLSAAATAFAQTPALPTPPPLAATGATPAMAASPAPAPVQAMPAAEASAAAPMATAPAINPPVDAAPVPPAVAAVVTPMPVSATPLQAPDLFSAEAGPTGLPSNVWRDASADLARIVIPMLSQRPMTPAASAFARRLMSTGSTAPFGAGADLDLAAARIAVVLSLGDAAGAHAMVQHTPGLRQNAALAHVAAEADLVLGLEDEACAIGDGLTVGKDQPYFRRLRAYCLLKAGDLPGAQLAYDLADEQAKDDVYKRLVSAAVVHTPPGDASLRNGLEFALSRRLLLDMAPAMTNAWAPIPPVVAKDPTAPLNAQAAAAARVSVPLYDISRAGSLNPAVRDAALALADNKITLAMSDKLVGAGQSGSLEAQGAAALYAAVGAQAAGRVRAIFAGFDLGKSTANQARLLELDGTGTFGNMGDAALLALWLAADAGEAGPTTADRARIVRALFRAGFKDDARIYALEGVLGLRPPPPPPPPPPPKKKPVRRRTKGG